MSHFGGDSLGFSLPTGSGSRSLSQINRNLISSTSPTHRSSPRLSRQQLQQALSQPSQHPNQPAQHDAPQQFPQPQNNMPYPGGQQFYSQHSPNQPPRSMDRPDNSAPFQSSRSQEYSHLMHQQPSDNHNMPFAQQNDRRENNGNFDNRDGYEQRRFSASANQPQHAETERDDFCNNNNMSHADPSQRHYELNRERVRDSSRPQFPNQPPPNFHPTDEFERQQAYAHPEPSHFEPPPQFRQADIQFLPQNQLPEQEQAQQQEQFGLLNEQNNQLELPREMLRRMSQSSQQPPHHDTYPEQQPQQFPQASNPSRRSASNPHALPSHQADPEAPMQSQPPMQHSPHEPHAPPMQPPFSQPPRQPSPQPHPMPHHADSPSHPQSFQENQPGRMPEPMPFSQQPQQQQRRLSEHLPPKPTPVPVFQSRDQPISSNSNLQAPIFLPNPAELREKRLSQPNQGPRDSEQDRRLSENNNRPPVQFMGFLNKHTLAQQSTEQPAFTPTIATTANNPAAQNASASMQESKEDERSVPFFDIENSVETKWLMPLTPASFRFAGHCATDVNTHLLLFGGFGNDESGGNQTFLIQTSPKNVYKMFLIRAAGDVPYPRERHSACRIGKNLYIFGGYLRTRSSETYYDNIYQFDSDALVFKKLEPVGDIPEKRCGHSCVVIDNKMYIIGGRVKGQNSNSKEYRNDVYCFDTALCEWRKCVTRGNPPCPRASAAAVAIGHLIYYFGGANAQGDSGDTTGFCDFYQLDTSTMVWSEVIVRSTYPLPRFSHTLTDIGNDRILLFGGKGIGAGISSFHIFNFNTTEWIECTYLGNKLRGRWGHTATLHHQKFLIVVGGKSDDANFESVLVINIEKELDFRKESEKPQFIIEPVVSSVKKELESIKKSNKVVLSLVKNHVESIAIEVALLGEGAMELEEETDELRRLFEEIKMTQSMIQEKGRNFL